MRARGWGIAALVWLCACSLTTVQWDHSEIVTITAGEGRFSGDIGIVLGTDLAAVTEGDIQGVSLDTFSITAAPGGDVAYLDRVDVYLEADGLPRILVATGSGFPAGTRTVWLEPVDQDLTDYLLADDVALTTEVTGAMPAEDSDLDVHVVVDIGVTPKGACNALEAQKHIADGG